MPRNARRNRDATISLTPMIDIMTVLLGVFMVTTPMLTAGIDLNLPNAGHSVLSGGDHAIQISVDARGNYYMSRERMSRDAIVARAVAMRAENPDLSIMISGDRAADYGAVMSIMGKLKDVGFTRVGLRSNMDK